MSDKKYPWIKSIFKKKRPAEGVYAGPEMMNNRAPGEDENCETEPVDVVYGGPDMIKKPQKPEIIIPEPDKPVYAGPEFFDQGAPVEDVYAGPEPYEDPDYPEEDAEVPEDTEESEKAEESTEKTEDTETKKEKDGAAERDAQARPVPPPPRPNDPRMFMTVYAGPDFFAGKKPNVGAIAFPAAQDGDKKKIFCPYCGTPNADENKFCTECGSVLKK